MKNISTLVKESKKLLPHANYEQKKLIFKMLEMAKKNLDKEKNDSSYLLIESDYLQEK